MEKEMTAVQKLINTAIEFCVNYSFQVLGAVIILILGFILANWAAKLLLDFFQKNKADITLSKFLAGGLRLLVLGFAVIIAMGKFGISITPFVAALSAMAFGTGIALQGPLSNYAAGFGIIMGRPFVVGDTITIAGVSGVVTEVKLASTILTDEAGVKITIPNHKISGEILHNSQANKMMHGVVGISYEGDPEKAARIIRETLAQIADVRQNPKPQIGIQEFADSSINIGYRFWVPTVKYFQTSYAANLAIYKALQSAKISIPSPQREVRILSGFAAGTS